MVALLLNAEEQKNLPEDWTQMNAEERGGEKNLPENWAQQRVNVNNLPIR